MIEVSRMSLLPLILGVLGVFLGVSTSVASEDPRENLAACLVKEIPTPPSFDITSGYPSIRVEKIDDHAPMGVCQTFDFDAISFDLYCGDRSEASCRQEALEKADQRCIRYGRESRRIPFEDLKRPERAMMAFARQCGLCGGSIVTYGTPKKARILGANPSCQGGVLAGTHRACSAYRNCRVELCCRQP